MAHGRIKQSDPKWMGLHFEKVGAIINLFSTYQIQYMLVFLQLTHAMHIETLLFSLHYFGGFCGLSFGGSFFIFYHLEQ